MLLQMQYRPIVVLNLNQRWQYYTFLKPFVYHCWASRVRLQLQQATVNSVNSTKCLLE